LLSYESWKRWTLALVCGCALFFLYFFGLTRTGLLSTDEPRYAAIGRAMEQTGDWVTPTLWGHPWFEKPVLLYWMTAVGFKAGLDEDLAPRLPVALLSVAFLLYFFAVLRREFGGRAALYATTILATSAGWLAYSHVAVTDLPVSATFAVAMLLAWRTHSCVQRSQSCERSGLSARAGVRMSANTARMSACATGVLLGVAVLAKGLVPLVLFLPAVWFLRQRIRDLLLVFASAAVVALPWYVLVTVRNGAPFLEEFIWKQHFARFFTASLQHEQPFWYFIPVLLAGLFPWSPLALLLFSRRLFEDRRLMFLLLWFAWGFVLFSLSRNKLPGYLLPTLPSIGALLGIAAAEAPKRSAKVIAAFAACAALLWLVPAIQNLLPDALLSGVTHAHLQLSTAWLLPAVLATAAAALLEWRGQRDSSVALIALLSTVLVVRLIWQAFPVLDSTVSARAFWRAKGQSITCINEANRSWYYGLHYYSGRDLSNCK
jgi:4-amino-4-deoxy-L-arabinose transferase-like glycosyltransferase